MVISSEQNDPHQILLEGVLYNYFKLIYASLNEVDKVHKCYSCWKMVTQAHLHVDFFRTLFIKCASLK